MGNRDAFQGHVLAYLRANSKVRDWDVSYARISGMTNRKEVPYTPLVSTYSFIQTVFTELLHGIQLRVHWQYIIQMNHTKENMVDG